MTQTSYPFENINTTEAQYSQLFRRLNFTGVAGVPGDNNLKVSGDSSGLNVKVSAGFAMVRGHFYKSDAQETLAIGAGVANPRRDLIVLRLDPAANSIVLAVKAGTAAASPSDPSLTQTDEGLFEVAIARVNVAANATTISAGNVDDLRPFMGAPIGRWTTATRPTGEIGLAGFNTTLGTFEHWTGSAWAEVRPTSIPASLISAAEQANIAAGKIRSGANPSNAAITMFVQSSTPTANAAGDLWFW
jgi:hypothetical protein